MYALSLGLTLALIVASLPADDCILCFKPAWIRKAVRYKLSRTQSKPACREYSSGEGEQAGVTHSQVSFLRFPIVDGMVPDRSLLSRSLGMRGGGRRAGRCVQGSEERSGVKGGGWEGINGGTSILT